MDYWLAKDKGELNGEFWKKKWKGLEAFNCWTMWEQVLDTEEQTGAKEWTGAKERTGVMGQEKDGRSKEAMDVDVGTSGSWVDVGGRIVMDEERLETSPVRRDTVPLHGPSLPALTLVKDFGRVGPSAWKLPPHHPEWVHTWESQCFQQLTAQHKWSKVTAQPAVPSHSHLQPPTIKMSQLMVGLPSFPQRMASVQSNATQLNLKCKSVDEESLEEDEEPKLKFHWPVPPMTSWPGDWILPVPTGVFFEPHCIQCWQHKWMCKKQAWGQSACVGCGMGKVKCYWSKTDGPPPKKRQCICQPVKCPSWKIMPESEDQDNTSEPEKIVTAKGKIKSPILVLPARYWCMQY